jgi:predicted alpha-1,6-mannanase (GH76 family)
LLALSHQLIILNLFTAIVYASIVVVINNTYPKLMKRFFLGSKLLAPGLFITLFLSACSKKSDPTSTADTPVIQVTPVTPITPVTPTPGPVYNYSGLSDSLQNTTYAVFLSANGQYFVKNNSGTKDFNYWPNAHMLDVLTDGYLRTKNTAYLPRMKALLNGIKASNGNTYSNEFYDDMGWMANASLRDYVITNDADYLTVAQSIYAEIKTGSNTTAGGGMAWRKSQLYYKNIPTTGNMCILASRFYKLQNKPEDLAFAKNLYDWMKTNLVNGAGEVQDGINRNNDGKVDNWIFTYNQGLFIGSAVELYNITKNQAYLQDAILTANNALIDANLIKNGILKSEGQGDGGLFKGVIVRYLTLLVDAPDIDETNRSKFALFLQRNSRSLYLKAIARPSLMISPDWTIQPSGSTDLSTQLSGMMMMEAAARLKTEGRIEQ